MSTDYSAKIRDHLTKQRKQAVLSNGTCMYRAERFGRTLMCAVGCLIPDDKYDNAVEGLTILNVPDHLLSEDHFTRRRAEALRDALPADLDYTVARYWQKYHDNTCRFFDDKDKQTGEFNYATWCDNDMPGNSPAAFYDALKVHMADLAEVHHG